MPGHRPPEPDEPRQAYRRRLAELRALSHKRSVRSAEQAFVLEGPTAVAEALKRGVLLREVFCGVEARDDADTPELGELAAAAAERGALVHRVDARKLARSLSTVTPRPVAAIAAMPPESEAALGSADVLVAVGIAEPGNFGTLVRTAEAAGFGAVLCCDGAVDPFNPKAVRASAGAICSFPVITRRDSVQALEELGELGYCRVAARVDAASRYFEVDWPAPVAVVLGNEAHGLAPHVDAVVDRQVRIPMASPAESLNVAAAGAVLCFEASRRRHAAEAS